MTLAVTLVFGLIAPALMSTTAVAATQEIGAVATAFQLSGESDVTNVKVHWSTVSGASNYELMRSETETSGFATVAKAPTTTFDDYGLETGRTYFYQVRALDGAGATLAQSTARASTYTPSGTFKTYDNTQPSSLSVKSTLVDDGVYYRYDYQSDSNGFSELVEKTSTDGYTFTGSKVVLSRDSDPALVGIKLESMNIRKNPTTGEFVLWAHYENKSDYSLAQVAVAHAVPGESFHFDGTYRPNGNQSRDLTFFVDDDGTGYLVSAANNNADLIAYKLSADWLTIAEQTATLFAGQNREAPAMVHVDGYYYLFTSEAAGWYPSQGQYASATSPAGPWTALRDIGNTATFGAQSGGIVRIGDQYAMMANRWGAQWKYPEAKNSGRMLPISFNEGYAGYDYFQNVAYDPDGGSIVPVQNGKILSVGKPARSSGLSTDAANEDVLYNAPKANDGLQTSKDNYYKSDKVPFMWEVDLLDASVLSHLALTSKMVKGSETYYSYKIEASLDRKSYTQLVDETANQVVGFKSHDITSAEKFRYVRVTVTKVTNINNGNAADWARGIGELTVFGTPTADPAPDTVETPVPSVPAGTYYTPQSVTLSSATAGAEIHYTTDGSTPSKTNGTTYTGTIDVAATTTLKAVAVKDGLIDSTILTSAYVIKAGATPISLVSPVYSAVYTGQQPALPTHVNVKTADGATRMANVTWDLEGYSFDSPYRSLTVYGTVENSLNVTAQVEVVPTTVKYFIDSGMAGKTSPPFEGVKSLVGSALLNQTPDQPTSSGSWGYITSGGFDGTFTPGTPADKDSNGIYGKNSPDGNWLRYTLPNLPAGTYTVTAGFREWWSGPRTFNVLMTNTSGTNTTLASNVAVALNKTGYSPSAIISQTWAQNTTGTATFNVARSAGTEAPVVSWLAIASGTVAVDTTPLVVNTPTTDVAAGIYKTTQTVSLATTTAGATIYYTTDGSDASKTNGTKYTAPIVVDRTETIKAVAFKNGTLSSQLAVAYDIEPVPDSYSSIPVGKTWYDTNGDMIQAHGGGFLEKDGWYYWVGENKSHNAASFKAVSLYKSQDLKNWTFVKDILTPKSAPELADCKVERPKLLYNKATDTYVLWGHWETADSYAASHLVVATSKTIGGDYEFVKHFRPGVGEVATDENDPTYTGGDGKWGYGSRDMTVFKDPDTDDAYLVSSQDHLSMRMYKLTDDYDDIDWEHSYPLFEGQRREAPAMVKAGDYYYVFTSSQSGWYPNQTMYSYTKDISDPHGWSALKPIGNNTTFYSQPTNIMTIQGEDGHREYIYMGDRWKSKALGTSTYVWLPLKFNALQGSGAPDVTMNFQPTWSLDTGTGSVTVPPDRLVSQGKPVEAAASSAAYPPAAANDGNLFNLSVSGDNTNYYLPPSVPFTWTVDLQKQFDLSRIDLSFRSYNGSETYSGYTVDGSNDKEIWTRLVSETANQTVGFKSNPLTGQYRYVRVSVSNVINDHNGSAAAWAAGLVEVQVYNRPVAQTIAFEALPDMIIGSADFNVQADASSGLPVTFSASGVCTISGASVHLSGPGTCAVTASQLGNENYAAAPDVTRAFNVAYGVVVLSDLSTPVQRGDTLALALKLTDAAGKNLSSSTVTVHAIGIDGTQVAPAPGNSQPGQNFRFISTSFSYQYNIKTSGMAPGKHSLAYTAGLDPTTHTVSFMVRN